MKYLLMKFESTNYFKRTFEGLFYNIKLKVDKFKNKISTNLLVLSTLYNSCSTTYYKHSCNSRSTNTNYLWPWNPTNLRIIRV